MTEAMSPGAWDEGPKKEYTQEEFDNVVKEYVDARADYDAKKKESNEAYAKYRELEQKFIKMCEDTGKTKYHVDGIGSLGVYTNESVSVPKGFEEKQQFLKYFFEQPEHVQIDMLTVHHQKLNSYYNAEVKVANEEGRLFSLPGVAEPTVSKSTKLYREKKK